MTRFGFSGLLALLTLGAVAVQAAKNDGINELQGLRTIRSRLPIYDGNQLKYHIFSRETSRQGLRLVSQGTIIDLVRPALRIEDFTFDEGQQPYPLNAGLAEVVEFWRKRSFGEGVIFTDHAEIDQDARAAAGEDPVYARSPLLDLDGVGFQADFNRKLIAVNSQVRIVIRQGVMDPRIILKSGKLPPRYESIKAEAEALQIDQNKGEITLSGKVRVDEGRSLLFCDRLVIRLNSDRDLRAAQPGSDGLDLGGVREIICSGEVRIERKLSAEELQAHGAQLAEAEELRYLVPESQITLTGNDARQPALRRGDESMSADRIVIFRAREELLLYDRCRIAFHNPNQPENAAPSVILADRMDLNLKTNSGLFRGNVQVEDPQLLLSCGQMNVRFVAGAEEAKKPVAETSGVDAVGDLTDFNFGGGRELSEVICFDSVRVTRRAESGAAALNERAQAGKLELDYRARKITLTENSPTLIRGNDSLSARELVIWLDQERLTGDRNSRIVLCSETVADPAQAPLTIITSDTSDLNYGGNRLVFRGNVQVRDPRLQLDCRQLEIFLADRAGAAPEPAADATQAVPNLSSGRKTVSRVVCTGEVVAEDPRATLRTEELTLYFLPVPPERAVAPNPFQSNGTELERITCSGNFILESKERTAAARTPQPEVGRDEATGQPDLRGLLGAGPRGKKTLQAREGQMHLRNNLTECHGAVKITEPEITLTCEDLYVHTRDLTPEELKAAAVGPLRKAPSIDDDPNELADPATRQIPDRLLIGGGKELVKTVAENQVRMVRKLPEGGTQSATGDRAVYTVADKQLVLTGAPARVVDEQGKQIISPRVLVDPESNRAWSDERTQFRLPTAE